MESNAQIQNYYVAVRPQFNEVHSVHREGCPFMPCEDKRIYLGKFISGKDAGLEGKKYYKNSHCCRFCLKETFEGVPHSCHVEIVPSQESMSRFLN